MSENPPTNSLNETTTKAKKARKPFVWTEQKRANFEKMRQKRADQLAAKKNQKKMKKEAFKAIKTILNAL